MVRRVHGRLVKQPRKKIDSVEAQQARTRRKTLLEERKRTETIQARLIAADLSSSLLSIHQDSKLSRIADLALTYLEGYENSLKHFGIESLNANEVGFLARCSTGNPRFGEPARMDFLATIGRLRREMKNGLSGGKSMRLRLIKLGLLKKDKIPETQIVKSPDFMKRTVLRHELSGKDYFIATEKGQSIVGQYNLLAGEILKLQEAFQQLAGTRTGSPPSFERVLNLVRDWRRAKSLPELWE